jgi:hypothetical protein
MDESEIPPMQTLEELEGEVAPQLAQAAARSGAVKQFSRIVRAELVTLEDLKMEPIDWVWNGWLARGTIHLIAGAPEAGKINIGAHACGHQI